MAVNLRVNIGGLVMQNPVTTCSGTFGFGPEYAPFVDLNMLGAITVKGTTLEPRSGNAPPRLVETPAGILNSVGLENPGVESLVSETMPYLRNFQVPVIVNIAGNSLEDYQELSARLEGVPGISALEVNISCPNVKKGGMAFGTDPCAAQEVISGVKRNTSLPVIAKLSPNVTDIVVMAKAAQVGGADALSLINTLLGMAIDIEQRKPILANTMGGLSGPAIKPVAVRMIWQVSQAVPLPIIGMGGITTWQDAVELMLAGATGVAVGTANFINPRAAIEIIQGIEGYMVRHGFQDVNEIVGLAWKKLQDEKYK
ncbi:MAG: dihydroorotate dehydrogenase [Dehalobacterium sp.]|jgi:dihydroorotate dehydrogenase (NAD+) catalytic subunit